MNAICLVRGYHHDRAIGPTPVREKKTVGPSIVIVTRPHAHRPLTSSLPLSSLLYLVGEGAKGEMGVSKA